MKTCYFCHEPLVIDYNLSIKDREKIISCKNHEQELIHIYTKVRSNIQHLEMVSSITSDIKDNEYYFDLYTAPSPDTSALFVCKFIHGEMIDVYTTSGKFTLAQIYKIINSIKNLQAFL